MNGHIRQRSPGTWELRYRAGGKTVTNTFRGTKREAAARLRELMVAADRGARPPSRATVGEWLTRWQDSLDPDLSPLTKRLYRVQTENHLRPLFGDVKLQKLDKTMIRAAWGGLADRLSPGSLRVLHRVLAASLSQAVEDGVLQHNPAAGWRKGKGLPKLPKAQHAIASPGDAAALVAAARGTPMFAPVVLGVGLGARRGEVAALRWRAINLETGEVVISEALKELTAADIRTGHTKGGEVRRIALPAFALTLLREWRLVQAQELLVLGARPGGDTFCCTDRAGQLMTPNRITDGFRALADRFGRPDLHYHSLRHTAASTALAAGASVPEVQKMLGHARASMTLDVYSHVVEGIGDNLAARLDAAFTAK